MASHPNTNQAQPSFCFQIAMVRQYCHLVIVLRENVLLRRILNVLLKRNLLKSMDHEVCLATSKRQEMQAFLHYLLLIKLILKQNFISNSGNSQYQLPIEVNLSISIDIVLVSVRKHLDQLILETVKGEFIYRATTEHLEQNHDSMLCEQCAIFSKALCNYNVLLRMSACLVALSTTNESFLH